MKRIRIGTYTQGLSQRQTQRFLDVFFQAYPALKAPGAIEIIDIIDGDVGKTEKALLAGDIDMIVRDLTNFSLISPEKSGISCYLPRDIPWDCVVTHRYCGVEMCDYPHNATVVVINETNIPLFQRKYPHINFMAVNGNDIETELVALKNGQIQSIIMPCSVARLLEMDTYITQIFDNGDFLPALGQGGIGVEILKNNSQVESLLTPLSCEETQQAIEAEMTVRRAFQQKNVPFYNAYGFVLGDKSTHLYVYSRNQDSSKEWNNKNDNVDERHLADICYKILNYYDTKLR